MQKSWLLRKGHSCYWVSQAGVQYEICFMVIERQVNPRESIVSAVSHAPIPKGLTAGNESAETGAPSKFAKQLSAR